MLPTKPDWSGGFDWHPGEAEALARVKALDLHGYDDRRNLPADEEGTSRLSPHLHFGEVLPRTVWHATGQANTDLPQGTGVARLHLGRGAGDADYADANGREKYDKLPWRDSPRS
ncbi:hypothetical protein AB5I41_01970 [Sphingomonas sp. MMS24-JH45]